MLRNLTIVLILIFGFSAPTLSAQDCCAKKGKSCCEAGTCDDTPCKDGKCKTGCCNAKGEVYAVKFDKIGCGKCQGLVKTELEKLEGVAKVGYCNKCESMMITLKKDASAPSKEAVEEAITAANEEFKLTSYEKFEMKAKSKAAEATTESGSESVAK